MYMHVWNESGLLRRKAVAAIPFVVLDACLNPSPGPNPLSDANLLHSASRVKSSSSSQVSPGWRQARASEYSLGKMGFLNAM